MVYLYKKIIGSKPRYYLRVSERKGKRVIAKDIAYLGDSVVKVKRALNNLKDYKAEIRKAHRTLNKFLETNHYLEKVERLKLKKDIYLNDMLAQVEACKLHYNDFFLKLDTLTRDEVLKYFVVEFAFNTTSIEGNTITLQEARNLLEEGLTPKNRTLREIYDLQNTESVFLNLDFKDNIGHKFMKKIHSMLMNNIDARDGYRTSDVRVLRSNFDAAPAPYIKTDLDLLLKWYERHSSVLHPLALAAIFHHKFEKIHPFYDGNGRTGRMLMNFILMKNNYPPIIIYKKTRPDYLDALQKADKSELVSADVKDYSKLIKFVAGELVVSYWNIFL